MEKFEVILETNEAASLQFSSVNKYYVLQVYIHTPNIYQATDERLKEFKKNIVMVSARMVCG